jgi:hypothetical protein
MEIITRPSDWFSSQLKHLRCSEDAKAYIVGVMVGYTKPRHDMSKSSIVLEFDNARLTGDFVAFQTIGDWTLWMSSIVPKTDKSQRELVERFGRLSYYECYRLLKKQWRLYEELADDLPSIIYEIRQSLVIGNKSHR